MLIVVPVTALYAGLCALLLLVLAARISRYRRKLKVGLGRRRQQPAGARDPRARQRGRMDACRC